MKGRGAPKGEAPQGARRQGACYLAQRSSLGGKPRGAGFSGSTAAKLAASSCGHGGGGAPERQVPSIAGASRVLEVRKLTGFAGGRGADPLVSESARRIGVA
jgi:hypothetical protein